MREVRPRKPKAFEFYPGFWLCCEESKLGRYITKRPSGNRLMLAKAKRLKVWLEQVTRWIGTGEKK